MNWSCQILGINEYYNEQAPDISAFVLAIKVMPKINNSEYNQK